MKCFLLSLSSVVAATSLAFAAGCSSSSVTPSVDASSQPDATGPDAPSGDAAQGGNEGGGSDANPTNGSDAGDAGGGPGEGGSEGGVCLLSYYDPAWDASAWDEDAAVPDAGDTWDGYMHGFFEKYCIECHHPGGEGDPTSTTKPYDFMLQTDVVMEQDTIRCGIIPADASPDPSWGCPPSPPPGQFPIYDPQHCNTKPTDAERWRVVAWIDAGSP